MMKSTSNLLVMHKVGILKIVVFLAGFASLAVGLNDFIQHYPYSAFTHLVTGILFIILGTILLQIRNDKYYNIILKSFILLLLFSFSIPVLTKLNKGTDLTWYMIFPVTFYYLAESRIATILNIFCFFVIITGHITSPMLNGRPALPEETLYHFGGSFLLLTLVAYMLNKTREYVISILNERADMDFLTEIPNRAFFSRELEKEYKMFSRSKQQFCLILFDIDHFKKLNDTKGHPQGDLVLKELAHLVATNIRSTDSFARWGGEEFILLLPQTHITEAIVLAEKTRNLVANTPLGAAGHKITASFGLSQITAEDSIDSILKRVDDLLYQAKNNGRNLVVHD